MLQWSDEILPNMVKNPQIPEAETHRELKEQLYYMMIDYFDKGKVWFDYVKAFLDDMVTAKFRLWNFMLGAGKSYVPITQGIR